MNATNRVSNVHPLKESKDCDAHALCVDKFGHPSKSLTTVALIEEDSIQLT